MRFQPYGFIHKGLRTRLFDVCVELGRADFTNPSELRLAIDAWRQTVAFLREHHALEENHAEPMLRPVAPEVVAANDVQHAQSDRSMAELDRLADAVEGAAPEARAELGLKLVERYHAFLIEYLQHMRHEETAMTAAFWAHFDDQQLHGLSAQIRASIPPPRFAELLGILLPAMNLDERAMMLGGIHRNAPAPAFAMIAGVAARVLGSSGWQAVRARAGIA
jgi:hypothetical protein